MMRYNNDPNEQELEQIKALIGEFIKETIVDSNIDESLYEKAIDFSCKKLCDLIDSDKNKNYKLHYLQAEEKIMAFAITKMGKLNGINIGEKYISFVSQEYRSRLFETDDMGEQYAIKYLNSNIDKSFQKNDVKIEEISASHKNKKMLLHILN